MAAEQASAALRAHAPPAALTLPSAFQSSARAQRLLNNAFVSLTSEKRRLLNSGSVKLTEVLQYVAMLHKLGETAALVFSKVVEENSAALSQDRGALAQLLGQERAFESDLAKEVALVLNLLCVQFNVPVQEAPQKHKELPPDLKQTVDAYAAQLERELLTPTTAGT